MAARWAVLLVAAAVLVWAPESVGAARQIFAGDLASDITAVPSQRRQLVSSEPVFHDPEEVDLFDLVNQEHKPPLGSNGHGGYGYGGYGYGHYCYGYGGYGYGGYGDWHPEDSDAAFEDLLERQAYLEARHRAHDGLHNREHRGYDVYGMAPGWDEDDEERRMARRVMRVEAEKLRRQRLDPDLFTDLDSDSDLDLLRRGASLLDDPDTEYGEHYGGAAAGNAV